MFKHMTHTPSRYSHVGRLPLADRLPADVRKQKRPPTDARPTKGPDTRKGRSLDASTDTSWQPSPPISTRHDLRHDIFYVHLLRHPRTTRRVLLTSPDVHSSTQTSITIDRYSHVGRLPLADRLPAGTETETSASDKAKGVRRYSPGSRLFNSDCSLDPGAAGPSHSVGPSEPAPEPPSDGGCQRGAYLYHDEGSSTSTATEENAENLRRRTGSKDGLAFQQDLLLKTASKEKRHPVVENALALHGSRLSKDGLASSRGYVAGSRGYVVLGDGALLSEGLQGPGDMLLSSKEGTIEGLVCYHTICPPRRKR